MKVRCINIDWLEVFALEPNGAPRDAEYFRHCGYKVKVRAYGTPQYREMFTLIADDIEIFEIRRNPYSVKQEGGIFEPNACHIRLCNRTCYEIDPVNHLRAFMVTHDYTYKSISRIDIALDFNIFDNKEKTENFIMRYMRGKVSKVNQSNVSAHGTDTWACRVFNSLKWGSPSSPVSTKLYNKTLELKQGEDKPYIRQAWQDAGLDTSTDVWRVEFSLSAQMQTLKSLKSGEMFRKSLMYYDSRERLLRQFQILYNKYFDFRKLQVTRKKNGRMCYIRKYDCPRLELFNFKPEDTPFKPVRNVTVLKRPDRVVKMLANRLEEIVTNDKNPRDVMTAAGIIIGYLQTKLRLDVDPTHKADAMIWEIEHVRQIAEHGNPDNWLQEHFEKRVLYHLMRKYGIVSPPLDCPF